MKSKYQKLIIFLSSLILCHNSIFSQNQERVSELYNYVIDALDQKDWETLDKHCTQLIKEVRSPDFADLVSIVSYMHIHAISALMNERKISQNEAIKKAKGYKGKVLIMPGHPFKEKCMFNCLYPTKENVKVLHCTSSDEKGTLIYSFEYYEMDEALRESFLTENEGKVMKIRARLKEIEVSGQMLPRFGMRFDKVEFQIMENPESEKEALLPSEFSDSLEVTLKHGVYINTLGSQIVRTAEFKDVKGEIVSVMFSSKFSSTKTNIVFEITDLLPTAHLDEITSGLDAIISDLNKKGGDDYLTNVRDVQKIEWPNFKGFDVGFKEKNDISTNYTARGVFLKDGRICGVLFTFTDTLGNSIPFDQIRNNLKLFLDKITIIESTNVAAKSVSKEHEALLKKMQIGVAPVNCNNSENDKKCLQVFVENTVSFTLNGVTSESFEKVEKHQDKGFVIPNTPGAKIKLIFSNGTEIVEHPFTIPKLP